MSRFGAHLATAVVAVFGLGASACGNLLQGNLAREPGLQLPSSFERGGGGGDPTAAPASAPRPAGSDTTTPTPRWDELFQSAPLRGLIDAALAHNLELSSSAQEVLVAQSEAAARRGEYWPMVRAGLSVGAEKVGRFTSQGASDEANGVPPVLGDFRFGLTASWEVDVWQRLTNAAKAAGLRAVATEEARNFLVTQLVAEVARAYFELVAVDNQLAVLDANIALQANALAVVRAQQEAARATALAVQRFEAELLKNQGKRFDLVQARVQLENQLNVLVGRVPQAIDHDRAALDAPPPSLALRGVPAELLEHRPDIRRAARELEAAKLDVAAAKAAFYPSLSVDAGLGYRSFSAQHVLDTPGSLFFLATGSVSVPLFNRQAIEAQYRTANARQVQAVVGYERTLLQAFTEVATALAMVDNLRKGCALQADQVATLGRAVDSSITLFQSARADYMEVLLTRRDYLDAQFELIDTKKRQLHAAVRLYQALGGGWHHQDHRDIPAAASSSPLRPLRAEP